MISLQQIEEQLKAALKARDQIAVDTLRGLKTRVQNEQIAKIRELKEEEMAALVRSELKRRQEAAKAFTDGSRLELAEKELAEASVLEKFLPPQMPPEEIGALADKLIAENNFSAKDFGVAMGKLKIQVGSRADGAVVAKVLKEKLK